MHVDLETLRDCVGMLVRECHNPGAIRYESGGARSLDSVEEAAKGALARLVATHDPALSMLERLARRTLDDADNTPRDTAEQALAFLSKHGEV